MIDEQISQFDISVYDSLVVKIVHTCVDDFNMQYNLLSIFFDQDTS